MKIVKCILRQLTDEQMAIVVVEENLRHETLNAIEEGRGYSNMRDKFHWTEEEIATKFGTTRDVVAQRMRLLTFQEPIQALVAQELLTISHAEAIATAPVQKQVALARRVLNEKLTVIQTTTLAKQLIEQQRTNQEALENIGATVINLDQRLKSIECRPEVILIGADPNAPPMLLAKPIKANLCRHNVNGICEWIGLSGDQVNEQFRSFTKKLEDGQWHVRACASICSLCELFEPRSSEQHSVQDAKHVT
jgi:ParB-like chromosome segregation protein Spo0J